MSTATFRGEAARIRLRDPGAQPLEPDVVRTGNVAGIALQLDGERLDVAVEDSVAGLRRVIAERAAYAGGGFLDGRGEAMAW